MKNRVDIAADSMLITLLSIQHREGKARLIILEKAGIKS